jgi:NAD(P)-dependent dehydrogenase (short-subunit alcohol dehydrogenase family)
MMPAAGTGHVPLEPAIQSPAVDFSKPADSSTIRDRTILITGGASGLGAGFFTAWAALGANVVIGDINEDSGRRLVDKTRASTKNANLHFLPLDVTSWESQVAFFREASKLSPHRGIDCVVANAGISGGSESMAFEEPPDYTTIPEPPKPSLATIQINLVGVLYTTNLAISYLSRNPGSARCSLQGTTGPRDRHIILVSSIAGLQPLVTQSVYGTSKHGVIGTFRNLRVTAPILHGIRVNALCPYFVHTPIIGVEGPFVLAGGAPATVEAVVEAATRLVADSTIIGRGLAISPKASMKEATEAGLDVDETQDGDRAIWDVYAHDFEQSDIFTRRVVALTNIKGDQRGLLGLLADLGWAVTSPIRRLFG